MIDDPRRINVLHVLGPLRPSGMERMLISAAHHFREAGIDGTVYGTAAGSTFVDELLGAGYDVILGSPIGSSVRAARAFRRAVRERAVNVVHVHTEGDYLRTVLAARWALAGQSGAIARTIHSEFPAEGRWLFSRKLQSLIGDRFVSAFIVPSKEVAATELSLGRECDVIYNWVDDRFFSLRESRRASHASVCPARRPRALIVGNCSDIKGHAIALRAIWDAGMDLLHIGDETQATREELELLARFESSRRLIQRDAGAPDEGMVSADVFCMPSRREGFGVALAEAVVVGVPVVASNISGFHWVADAPGVALVPDDHEAWVRALRCAAAASTGGQSSADVDLSARRGAREYAAIYLRTLRDQKASLA